MPEPAKETVIIVHGTWAAPGPGESRWYQPVDGVPRAAEGFVSKLDAALQERGSAARCWAHCTERNPFFQWSGENSWIARTLAAVALADYVAKLRKEGWRCHIVAHSHGGNVVVEALPQIATPSPNQPPGTIVTLGSPFMDTMSPVLKRARRARRILDVASLVGFATFMAGLAFFIYLSVAISDEAVVEYFSYWRHDLVLLIFFLPIMLLVLQWLGRTSQPGQGDLAQAQPPFLAIGSLMDEAWQILHHTRNMQNPLAVKSNLLSYLFFSLRSNILRGAQVTRIQGAKSYRDLGIIEKIVMAMIHVVTFLAILFIIFLCIYLFEISETGTGSAVISVFAIYLFILSVVLFVSVLFLTKLLGETFYSAFLSPFRWCMRQVGSLGSIFH